MEPVTRVQIQDAAVCISFYANAFRKGMNQSAMSKELGKRCF